ncbi:hypothetical protein TOPH_06157 [Tolypocladium ophioglossoides CBS 100239]|uniref:RRM domain-containing protein n=1 Tax=Tolypocladium ophioglossoides (strain CBS 100239) TaxID=1163406 RepID=A0A0L0N4S7_TOLOC|nr:hypothetical protein TOPH_06157 [Tolypocladium ophioglossoides CBS 100239]
MPRPRPTRLPRIGNLSAIKPHDVEEVLADNGFGDFEQMHVSIDPVSARNPGYCFVDFPDRATADRAIASLSAPSADGPSRSALASRRSSATVAGTATMARTASPSSDGATGAPSLATAGSPSVDSTAGRRTRSHGTLDHFDDTVRSSKGRRLCVGGLRKMIDQAQNNREMAELSLVSNRATAIGKRITPHGLLPRRFRDQGAGEPAMTALNGRPFWGRPF